MQDTSGTLGAVFVVDNNRIGPVQHENSLLSEVSNNDSRTLDVARRNRGQQRFVRSTQQSRRHTPRGNIVPSSRRENHAHYSLPTPESDDRSLFSGTECVESTDGSQQRQPARPRILSIPSSKESRLTSELCHALVILNWSTTAWAALIPPRVGHDAAVDYGAEALIASTMMTYNASVSNSRVRSARAYSGAVTSLQNRFASGDQAHITSDNTLCSIGLLMHVDFNFGLIIELFSHQAGAAAILLSRPASRETSDFTRAWVYHGWERTFMRPCALGIASPFDSPRWLALQPYERDIISKQLTRLRYNSYQLTLRLPRLIMLVRKLRQDADTSTLAKAINIATELCSLQETKGESDLLHLVKVQKTTASFAWWIPYSFDFRETDHYQLGLLYWQTQLYLGNLCRFLHSMSMELAGQPQSVFTDFVKHDERVIMNILMSIQWSVANRPTSSVPMILAWYAAWQALSEIKTLRKVPTSELRKALLEVWNDNCPFGRPPMDIATMDADGFLFAGGPLAGALPDMYRHEASGR